MCPLWGGTTDERLRPFVLGSRMIEPRGLVPSQPAEPHPGDRAAYRPKGDQGFCVSSNWVANIDESKHVSPHFRIENWSCHKIQR